MIICIGVYNSRKGAKDGQSIFFLHDGAHSAGDREWLSLWIRSYDGDGAGEWNGLSGAAEAGGRGLRQVQVGEAESRAGRAATGAQVLRSDEGRERGARAGAQAVPAARTTGRTPANE